MRNAILALGVHDELLQATAYFPMNRDWLALIDPVAGGPQPFDPNRDLRINCDYRRPVPLPVPKKIPLQAIGLSLPRRSTAVALIYFIAECAPKIEDTAVLSAALASKAQPLTLTGPISSIDANFAKVLGQLFPMVTLLDAPQIAVFRLSSCAKSAAPLAWDLTFHPDSTVCDRCTSGSTTSIWGCWNSDKTPAAHYHICSAGAGEQGESTVEFAPSQPIKHCDPSDLSISMAAAHLIYDRCWTRYQIPVSNTFGQQALETVPGYDACWDCTAEAHTWLHYMRFRHSVVKKTEPYKAADYMRILGDVLKEPLNPSHSGHGRFVSPRARSAVLAAGYTVAASFRAAKKRFKTGGAAADDEASPGGAAADDEASPGGAAGDGAAAPTASLNTATASLNTATASPNTATASPDTADSDASTIVPSTPRYAVIHGDVPDEDRTAIQQIWQSTENRYGGLIRGILVTKAGATGLDLSGRQVHLTEPYWDKSLETQTIARFRRMNVLDYLPEHERNIQPYLYLAVGNQGVMEGMPQDAREMPVALAGELPRGTTVDVAFHERALQVQELNESYRELLRDTSIECGLFRDPAVCRICRPTSAPLFHATIEEDFRLPDPCTPIRPTTVSAKTIKITLADGTPATFRYVEDPTATLGYRFYQPDTTMGWNTGNTYMEVDPALPLYMELLGAVAPL